MTGQLQGTIIKIFGEKRFGFVADLTGKQYFFHKDDAPRWDDMDEGDKILFTPIDTPKGLRAKDVCFLGE